MPENWKLAVDNPQKLGAILTDLTRPFGCLSDELLTVKLKMHTDSVLDH